NSYTVRSTIVPQLQRAVEESLQEGLWRYERSAGRVQFRGAEANLAQAVQKIEANKKNVDKRPVWQQALVNARLPLYDVHWTPALLVDKPGGGTGGSKGGKRGDKKGDASGGTWRVGLSDGRIVPLALDNANAQRMLKLYDVVFVRLVESKGGDGKGKAAATARAELRVRPAVQGTAVGLENKTGRRLAVSGGLFFPPTPLHPATPALRPR